ncbi:MAG: hypothetical protein AB7W47_04255 [Calditrichaceae bacterium]
MEKDTLIYQESFSTPLSENYDRYFGFRLTGYYYDEPLSLREINENLNLEGFFYFYANTIQLY